MKRIVYILVLFSSISLFSQDFKYDLRMITSSNEFKAIILDSLLISDKSKSTVNFELLNYLKSNKEIKSGFIEFPKKTESSIEWDDEYISIYQIAEVFLEKPTSNSVVVYIPNTNDMAYVYVRYRRVEDIWIETTKSMTNIKTFYPLEEKSEYEYIVYWVFKNRLELRSKLLTFSTL